jgi:hypothetical protein
VRQGQHTALTNATHDKAAVPTQTLGTRTRKLNTVCALYISRSGRNRHKNMWDRVLESHAGGIGEDAACVGLARTVELALSGA